ncbi:hypothetical protein ACH5RR_009032 [Cinchona calisaya]|uniref:Uncharacterized protein n=1 Tax=Cinchona calisaya TaxID=153742 RepID=A0ABD3AGX5_9GENT
MRGRRKSDNGREIIPEKREEKGEEEMAVRKGEDASLKIMFDGSTDLNSGMSGVSGKKKDLIPSYADIPHSIENSRSSTDKVHVLVETISKLNSTVSQITVKTITDIPHSSGSPITSATVMQVE